VRLVRAFLLGGWDCAWLVLSIIIAGCPKPLPAPTTPPSLSMLCLGEPNAFPGSCGDLYTQEGYSCVICSDQGGCVSSNFLYCVSFAAACDDQACRKRP
jgi:hypothetical protein